ncbi:type I restriction enzyme, S subunit [Desemzia incerta]|uniref:Type I restriction enzyme, S subunit n=1 Tax=Desemzia incerta TaxID=82801 RepID=A0A1I5Y4H5_9LACT|nr:restriction endonuclease subunit S [Desemzia incerta]SFQ39086.1 type I restriction enzyme, S subunit [Desemzia incerta]
MSINKNSQKTPNLRFKGFTDDWEQRKLGDLGSVVMNKRIFKDETFENGEIPFFKIGTFGGKPDAYITREKFEDYKSKYPYPQVGDILISASGSIGKTIEYKGEEAYYQDSNIVWLKHNGKLDNLFLKHFYSIVKWNGIEGTTIKRLYNKNILQTTIIVPFIQEQIKIGNFFKQLDDTIALHQRKLDQLKQLKAALLQQMFPGKGETVPKLRFAGFEGDWEERKLGSIYDFSKGKGLPLDSFTHSKDDPAIAYGHLYTKYSEVISEVYLSSDDDGVLSKENDLLFPGSSTVPNGTAQANAIMLNNVKLGGDIIIARPKQDIRVLSIFMSYQINSQRQKLFPITVGTTIAHMYGKDLSKVEFFMTNYSEQEKISDVFKQLDNTITLQQRKLDQLKNTKQVLLKNMFI